MTNSDDVFERAARRFVDDLANERGVAGDQVSEGENKEREDLVVELEDDRLGGDRLREGLLELDRSGEHVREEEGPEPEKVVTTIKVDGEEKQVEIVEYENGSVRDVATGRFLAPPSPNVFEDPEKARAAVTTRHAKATEEARMGLIRGVVRKGHEAENAEQAWGVVVEEQAVAALSDKRGATGAARFIGVVTGLAGEEKEQQGVSVPGGVVVVTDFETILLGMFNRLHPDDPQRALSEMKAYRDELK